MDAAAFPEGSYSVDTSIDRITGIKPGDFIAYKIPKEATSVRIGRVIGLEGMRVEVTPKEVLVNGAPLAKQFQTFAWTIPEIRVPRGCLYVLADNPSAAQDSKTLGAIPFSHVLGTVKPSH